MSANVEQMFYVREKPWHGIGERVEEALCSEEALKVAQLDWQVVGHPVFVDGVQQEGYIANVRDRDNKVLGIVSEKYKVVQNTEAFAFTDALLNMDVRYETAGSLNNGKRIWLLAKMPETKILNDKVEPYLVFTNSHDGTGSIRVAVTPIRVVCQNTLNLALNGAKRQWSTKHMGDMQLKLEEAKRTLELAETYMKQLDFDAVEMAKKVIDDATIKEFKEMLFPFPVAKDVTPRKLDNIKIIRANFDRCYDAPDLAEFRNTQWGVINAISDMVTHIKPFRNTPNFKENLWGKIIDGNAVIDEAYSILTKIAA